ncbi:MAG: bifunctional phosphoglucose/phosphomannose isomerase [Candidatus Eisenbacteria bacterium]
MLDGDTLKLDSSDMLGKIAGTPDQLRTGFDLGREAWKPLAGLKPSALVVAGMGGSAMGGDLLRSYALKQSKIPVTVSRGYSLPGFVDSDALVVVSSYSGNTEEALACLGDAIDRNATIAGITSGGELLAAADRHSMPCVRLPEGYPPRAALGYSFGALLALAGPVGLCETPDQDLAECIDTLRNLNKTYGQGESCDNRALAIAGELLDKTPLIYCSDQLSAVGLRWKNQFCENSKKLAFLGLQPEMSHNDIMGWEIDDESIKGGVIILRMRGEHPRISPRFAFLEDRIREHGAFCGEFWGVGSSLLTQVFSLILLGDYASVYLALMRGVDPTPIATIDGLKVRIGKEGTEQ